MICPKCSSSISDNAKFCRLCGSPILLNKTVTPMYSSSNDFDQKTVKENDTVEKREESNSKHFLIWLLIVLTVTIASIIFFVIVGINKGSNAIKDQVIDEEQMLIQLHRDDAMKCAELELRNKLYYVMEGDHEIHYESKIVDEDKYGRYYIEVTVTTKSYWGQVQSQLYSLVIYDVEDEETYKIDEKNGIMTSNISLYGSDRNAFLEWNDWGNPISK